MVPFYWKLITTVVRVTDGDGNTKYYESDSHQSINCYPDENKDLYKEISEDEFNKTQKQYEVPADLVKYSFADYNGKP